MREMENPFDEFPTQIPDTEEEYQKLSSHDVITSIPLTSGPFEKWREKWESRILIWQSKANSFDEVCRVLGVDSPYRRIVRVGTEPPICEKCGNPKKLRLVPRPGSPLATVWVCDCGEEVEG